MPKKRRVPGSPKGQPKPAKRTLDMEFPNRLAQALERRKITIPGLAQTIGCSRAVLHNYRKGQNKTIEALLLFELADALDVAARWLLTGAGAIGRSDAPHGEVVALQTIRRIVEATPRPHNERRGEPGHVERRTPRGDERQSQ